MPESFILIFSCNDKAGIQSKVSTFLFERSAFLTDVKSFSDSETNTFFSRVVFNLSEDEFSINQIKEDFNSLAADFDMDWEMDSADKKIKTIIAVSKYGHCLNDLLFRAKYRNMPIEIVGVVSNHEDFREIVEFNNIEFHYLPIEKDLESKVAQENLFQEIVTKTNAELVVLARYMQILTEELSDKWFGKCINIHHSFLPSFKGAKPYHQAFDRGVKVIGATAHYVTKDLDEGPIIEQDTQEVNHEMMPNDLVLMGRDIEARVLYRAIKAHSERRVFLNDNRTIVFRGQRI